jgi:hypothetical protein
MATIMDYRKGFSEAYKEACQPIHAINVGDHYIKASAVKLAQ